MSIVCLAVQSCLTRGLPKLFDHAPQLNAANRLCTETAFELILALKPPVQSTQTKEIDAE